MRSKTGAKLSKTGAKLSKNEVKTGAKPSQTAVQSHKYSINQPGTLITGCVLTPLGSPTAVPNWSYVHVPVVMGTGGVVHELGVGRHAGYGVWVAGWVYRVGNTGTYPASPTPREEDPDTAKRAP